MNVHATRFLRFAVGLLLLVMLGWVLTGQAAKPQRHMPLVTDWSHRHLIFSRPSTEAGARLVAENPRYWQQQMRRASRVLPAPVELRGANPESQPHSAIQQRQHKMHRDWAVGLGTDATVGATNFPAKFSFDIEKAPSCADDFVIFNTGPFSTIGQASVVAYNNLYSGCSGMGAVPSVYWAYSTGGQVLTAITYSQDGSQIAFVQTSGGAASLVLLKWAPSTIATVAAPVPLTPSGSYPSCAAPCMATLPLAPGTGGGSTDDTTSAVFYDYDHDIAWVGDNGGWLHQFHPVFKGAPAEVTVNFPVQVNGGAKPLTDPVYDGVSSVFVGDLGGYIYRVDASLGTVVPSARLDFGSGIVQGPVIDPVAGFVYVFSSSDGSTSCAGSTPCAAILQLPTNFTNTTIPAEALVGASSATPSPMYIGAFDTAYQASVNATGNVYVCGNTGGPPILFQVPIAGGAWGTPFQLGVALSSALPTTPCSPVTDIQNPNIASGLTEWIFASAQEQGIAAACGGKGCIFNLKVTPWQPNTAYALGDEVLDSNGNIQAVSEPGTSGPTAPAWKTTTGTVTFDPPHVTGNTHWLNQGPLTAATLPSWAADTAYSVGAEILDSNNNVEFARVAGTSGSPNPPTWPTSTGQSVMNDGTVTWRNLGPSATAALPAPGGTSGIIIDNIVISGTLAGTSQVYFSTLGNQVSCATSGSGGCAIQASQQELQ